jgi:hypothetical protein
VAKRQVPCPQCARSEHPGKIFSHIQKRGDGKQMLRYKTCPTCHGNKTVTQEYDDTKGNGSSSACGVTLLALAGSLAASGLLGSILAARGLA